MKYILHIVIVIMSTATVRAQTNFEYEKMDTLIYYSGSLGWLGSGASFQTGGKNSDSCTVDNKKGKGILYYSNCRVISKAEYDSLKVYSDNLAKCKPCVLKHYNDDGKLLRVSQQYTDCRIGSYVEYYESGGVKVIGNYKKNPTGNWKRIWKRGYCSEKEGEWTWYSEKGEIIKKEKYINGQLIE